MTMKQLALDIGLATGPTLERFFAGPNEAALQHLRLAAGAGSSETTRSPVPTYLWGCLLYTSPSPRDKRQSRMPSSA